MYTRHLKVLTLGLLVLVGVMAMSASAAQGKWLILLNGKSIPGSSMSVYVKHTQATHLLVPGLGLDIRCTSGEGAIAATLSSGEKVLSGSSEVTFTGCEEAEFGEVCDVSSSGASNGTIKVAGKSEFGMSGALFYALLVPLSQLEFSGEECPLTEIDGKLTGSLLICLLNPSIDQKLKVAHVVHQTVTFGEFEAEFENDESEAPLLSLTDLDPNATWAIHLVNL